MSENIKQKADGYISNDGYRGNEVGSTQDRILREKALILLSKARKIEAKKLKDGYRWMCKEKTMKLVPKSKIAEEKRNGFTFTKL